MAGVRANFVFDASSFTSALGDYARAVQDPRPKAEIVKSQLRYAFKDLDRLTPFSTLAEGRAAVRRDLLRAVKPYGGEKGDFSQVKNEGLRGRLVEYLRAKSYDKIKDVFEHLKAKGGFYRNYQMVDFDPEIHHAAQDSRGHVGREQPVLTPQVQEWREYLNHLRGQVGRARGGWVPSGEALGLSYPQWVSRWSSGGSVRAQVEPNRIQFDFVNRAIFIPGYVRQVRFAFQGREKAMAADLRRMYDGFKTHAGFGNR